MPDFKNSPNTRTHVGYYPAKLTEGKSWHVSFWAWDPESQSMRRKRIKINHISNLAERRRFAKQMITSINRDLEQGWSPWIEKVASRGMVKLEKAVDDFLTRKLMELEENSKRSYKSMIGRFTEWLKLSGKGDLLTISFTKHEANEYLDYLLEKKKVSTRTYNNYLVFSRTLFNWLIEREYLAQNPFTSQRKLRTKEKTRQVIPEDMRIRIKEHLMENDKGFLLCCYLLFYTEIRPGEQCGLRIRDVDFERQIIQVRGDIAKNKKSRFPTIPDVLLSFLKDLALDSISPDWYLISDDFKPGKNKIDPRKVSRKWDRLRKKLDIPQKYQFYSLRDSGIIWMLQNGVSSEAVMTQAGHADLEMTTVYARHHVYGAVPQIKDLNSGF